MPHWRVFFDHDFISAIDLIDQETGKNLSAVVTIAAVAQGQLQRAGAAKKKRAPVISFVGRTKKFVANTTNCNVIAQMYTPDTRAWIGKRITLYATTTTFGRDIVPCIRVKPEIPPAKAADAKEVAEPPVQVVAELQQGHAEGTGAA